MKILVVENSREICERILALLAASGKYEGIGSIASSLDALGLVDACAPDGALVDLRLDDGSGFELLKALRRRGYGKPIVMLSTSHGWQYQVQAKTLGANGFLCKSTQFEEIIPTLDSLFPNA